EYEEYDEEAGQTFTLTRQITVPADFSLAAERNEYKRQTEKDGSYKYRLTSSVLNRDVYRQRHELVMEIVNYLADEEKFTYTLTPEQTSDETLTGIEKFLDGNRQGYCVQFATTLTLLLREAGIPARYVDGYIAQSLVPSNSNSAGTYTATVRDRNAHAWVEVWFDGIGWIPYEATPPYYDGMYESRNSGSGSTIRPTPIGGDDEPDEPDDPGLTPEDLARLEEERRKEELRLLVKKIVTVTLVSLAVAALIALAVFLIAIRARKADKRREELMARLEAASKKDAPEADRKDVRALSDLIFLLLRVCRLYPKNGEFTDEFCKRLSDSAAPALMAGVKDPKLASLPPLSRPDVRRAFSAVAAEEFGFGCEKRDLPLILTLYRRLHAFEYKRHVNPLVRLKLHYFDNSL
ncbi:MAG: transglutaminase domain-containing protein, partial [Clostridia bacterium]|nr:transglutaminase domain-containing protein [Clostridia bacterium]